MYVHAFVRTVTKESLCVTENPPDTKNFSVSPYDDDDVYLKLQNVKGFMILFVCPT
jgi:hypothetical protein